MVPVHPSPRGDASGAPRGARVPPLRGNLLEHTACRVWKHRIAALHVVSVVTGGAAAEFVTCNRPSSPALS